MVGPDLRCVAGKAAAPSSETAQVQPSCATRRRFCVVDRRHSSCLVLRWMPLDSDSAI
jgi:hypothetical protein